MKIKMLKTTKGSIDGVTVNTYESGAKYDIPKSLALVFVEQIKSAIDMEDVKDEEVKTVEIETPERSLMFAIPEQPLVTDKPTSKINKYGRPAGSKNKNKNKRKKA